MPSNSNREEKSPLVAAQKIVEELTGMKSEHQLMAMKFATETLDLKFPGASSEATTSTTPITKTPPPPTQIQQPQPGNGGHPTDIRSFTDMKDPKTDQQFSAVVAYFYRFEAPPEQRKETIDSDIMTEAARLAGRQQVSRWTSTLNNAKNSGFLDQVSSGNFKLSAVGENLVAITLPGDSTPSRPTRRKTSKTTKKKTTKKATKKATKKNR